MGFFTKTREKGIKSLAKEKQKKQTTTVTAVEKKAVPPPVVVAVNANNENNKIEEQDKKRPRSEVTIPIVANAAPTSSSSLPWWVSDASFVVEGKKISAHKVVVTSKSKVLAALLEQSGNGTVLITQYSHNIFSQLIKWIYSAGFTISPQDAEELLSCALTFEVTELAEACSEVLRNMQSQQKIFR